MKMNLLKSLLLVAIVSITTACSKDDDGNAAIEVVTIDSQVWMKKNLDVTAYRNGDPIPQVSNPSEFANLTTGAWCYYDSEAANGKTYGKLYNWYAVNDPRGLAPAGWHIPNDDEWNILITFLGGEAVAGGKIKSTTSWEAPNTNATNSSGFTALPGGYYDSITGLFFANGSYGAWWSTTEYDADNASYYAVQNISADITVWYDNKHSAYSVRCIKD